ncbi:hypothetical protein M885DRAFT_520872 [Pelagophyceae sp. CCMP2097]|nr:hypothetical protein M885DRAFT_520872 [Pelagophyceae sp. CCMP2097]
MAGAGDAAALDGAQKRLAAANERAPATKRPPSPAGGLKEEAKRPACGAPAGAAGAAGVCAPLADAASAVTTEEEDSSSGQRSCPSPAVAASLASAGAPAAGAPARPEQAVAYSRWRKAVTVATRGAAFVAEAVNAAGEEVVVIVAPDLAKRFMISRFGNNLCNPFHETFRTAVIAQAVDVRTTALTSAGAAAADVLRQLEGHYARLQLEAGTTEAQWIAATMAFGDAFVRQAQHEQADAEDVADDDEALLSDLSRDRAPRPHPLDADEDALLLDMARHRPPASIASC